MGKIASAALALALLCAGRSSGQVASSQLIERSREHDGKLVEYRGELIGEPLRRADHLWINVSDGGSAIGIWVRRSVMPAVRYFGSYSARGDTVLVRGLFHKSCPEHGGDMDIHAEAIAVVAPGEPKQHRVKAASLIWALGLFAPALLAFVSWRRRERFLGGA
jgi:hypothetical protein